MDVTESNFSAVLRIKDIDQLSYFGIVTFGPLSIHVTVQDKIIRLKDLTQTEILYSDATNVRQKTGEKRERIHN